MKESYEKLSEVPYRKGVVPDYEAHLAAVAALEGDPYRIRVGNYRIIYTIENDRPLVVVVTLGHRRDVYGH